MISDLVSVIMPVYNASDFIEEAIESVLSQEYTKWELLVINDGSIDDSEFKILKFKDLRIHYFKQSNMGVSAARNLGLKNMSGEYFCFLDADDMFTTQSISSRISIFNNSPQTMFVDGTVDIYDKKLQCIYEKYIPKKVDDVIAELCKLSGNVFFGPSWMCKRDLKIDYKFDENISHGEDLYFYMKYTCQGLFGFTDRTILKYRKGHTSAMSNLDGLENGYRQIRMEMNELSHITKQNISDFKKKSRSIMFKSYLGAVRPLRAIISYVTW